MMVVDRGIYLAKKDQVRLGERLPVKGWAIVNNKNGHVVQGGMPVVWPTKKEANEWANSVVNGDERVVKVVAIIVDE